jgi:cleavage and polyadenylation specificity factor subunit 4
MAAATTATTSDDPHLGRAADFIRPDFHQVNLDIEGYLKTQRSFKLEIGK